MKKKLFAFIALITTVTSIFAAKGIRQVEIDETQIFEVKLHPDFVGTLLFPVADGIEGIHGSNITKNAQLKADFFVEFNPGTNFISVRATPTKTIDEKTKPEDFPVGSLNIIYKKKVIVVKLSFTTDKEIADKSVSFVEKKTTGSVKKAIQTTPGVLVSLIDKAKSYELYKKYHPEAIENIMVATELKQLSVYEDFDVLVQDAFRFDKFDTVILRLFIHNKSQKPLNLDTESFATRVGSQLLHASITDCAPMIPPQATIPAYVGFTGTEYGGRNNLSPDNQWKILVARSTKAQEKIENEKLRTLYGAINDNMTNEQLDDVEKLVETIIKPDIPKKDNKNTEDTNQ